MKKMLHYRAGSIFWLLIGVFIAIHANQLGLGRLRKPGPGFFFFLSAIFLISLSVIDIIVSIFKKSEKEDVKVSILGPNWKKVLLVVGSLFAYIYCFNILGFISSTFLLLVFLFKAVDPTKWWIAILNSFLTILISYLLFDRWLMVSFPEGILGF
jgi:putative tricarboxylic transport membrane protein